MANINTLMRLENLMEIDQTLLLQSTRRDRLLMTIWMSFSFAWYLELMIGLGIISQW